MNARLAGLGLVLRQQPYEMAIGLASTTGILELGTGRAVGSVIGYPLWLMYLLGSLLFAGGALTVGALVSAGVAFGDVHRVLARRVEQFGQFLLCGSLIALGSAAVSFGLRGAVSGAVDVALAGAALARAVTISRVIARSGRDDTGFGA